MKPLIGILTGYNYYLNRIEARVNMYLTYDFKFLKSDYVLIESEVGCCPLLVEKRNLKIFTLEDYFGFGGRFNIYKGFYINANVGTGFGWFNTSEITTLTNGNSYQYGRNGKPYFTNLFWPFPTGIFKIGLGYDLMNNSDK